MSEEMNSSCFRRPSLWLHRSVKAKSSICDTMFST